MVLKYSPVNYVALFMIILVTIIGIVGVFSRKYIDLSTKITFYAFAGIIAGTTVIYETF
jgi:hypothetical protein